MAPHPLWSDRVIVLENPILINNLLLVSYHHQRPAPELYFYCSATHAGHFGPRAWTAESAGAPTEGRTTRSNAWTAYIR